MAHLPLSHLMLALLAATAPAMGMGGAGMQHVLQSPVVQLLAEELGLQLPDAPLFNITADNFDINAVAERAAEVGCEPEVVSFPDDVRDAARDCVSEAYAAVQAARPARPARRRNRTRQQQRGRRGGRGGRGGRRGRGGRGRRSLEDMIDGMMVDGTGQMGRSRPGDMLRVMQQATQCLVARLNLTTDEGGLDQARVDELIDTMTATDDYKTSKKATVTRCMEATPSELSGAQGLQFQLACIFKLDSMDCMMGVANSISPTLGLLARIGASAACMDDMQPPPRVFQAHAACLAEEVSALMRERLETDTSSLARRRRDTSVLMMMTQSFGGMGGFQQTMESRQQMAAEWLSGVIAEVEAVVGPLDELFASIPERLGSAATCWFDATGTLSSDGTVDLDALRALAAEFSGPEGLTAEITAVIDSCEESGEAGTPEELADCLTTQSGYACAIPRLDAESEMPSSG